MSSSILPSLLTTPSNIDSSGASTSNSGISGTAALLDSHNNSAGNSSRDQASNQPTKIHAIPIQESMSNDNSSDSPSSGRKKRKERRAAKRAAESAAVSGATPSNSTTPNPPNGPALASGSAPTSKAGGLSGEKNKGFVDEADYIPLIFSDDEDTLRIAGAASREVDRGRERHDDAKGKRKREYDDDEEEGRDRRDRRPNGKAKQRAEAPVPLSSSAREDRDFEARARELDPAKRPRSEREWDKGKDRASDDGDADRYRHRDRDRDRGGRSNGKRKYDEYEEDRYANSNRRSGLPSKKCPWVSGLDFERCRNVAEMLHLEVESFLDWISPTSVEDEIRGLIVTQITKIVTSTFRDAQVHPFGSYQTKLYLPLGDIDLVVLSDTMAYSDKTTVLHALANALKRGGITSHVTIVAKAKVPIVKFTTTHGGFKVDISINQGNGLISGQIIAGFLNDMIPSATGGQSKALRSLIMITKAFLSQRSMNEVYTGGLGSYSIVCMAVSFLQMHPKIRRGEIDPEKNLGVLVMEFFELYGNYFNYDDVGISLRNGGVYFNKKQRGWYEFYKKSMISIEDPADPSNDISGGSYNFRKVRTAFAGAHGIMTSAAYQRTSILNARRHGRSFPLRDQYEPEDLSMLSAIMGITQETINHRKIVQELYDKGTLHKILGVKPRPTVVVDGKTTTKTESRREEVEKARSGVEKILEAHLDSEKEDYKASIGGRGGEGSRQEEGGRYDIGAQPPKKRRRLGKTRDAFMHFVPDEEEDDDSLLARMKEVEEGEYVEDDDESDESPRHSSSRFKDSRDYWLSKGIGVGGGLDYDSD